MDECITCGRRFDARPSDKVPICPQCQHARNNGGNGHGRGHFVASDGYYQITVHAPTESGGVWIEVCGRRAGEVWIIVLQPVDAMRLAFLIGLAAKTAGSVDRVRRCQKCGRDVAECYC